jgi:hypothetical protein
MIIWISYDISYDISYGISHDISPVTHPHLMTQRRVGVVEGEVSPATTTFYMGISLW